jgi:NADPH:quinone reductase
MLKLENLAELKTYLGTDIGKTDWYLVDQAMINNFADATGDHQWIHTNPEMCQQFSPFKTTVAHGFLNLSFSPKLMAELFSIKSAKMGLNYGSNKVRFMSPVPVNSKLRMEAKLIDFEEVNPNGAKIIMACTYQIEGQEKPACYAELISVIYE